MKHLAMAMTLIAALAALAVGGCGVSRQGHRGTRHVAARKALHSAPVPVRGVPKPVQALVTAQTENRLLVVGLPGARVIREVTVADDPRYVDAAHGAVVAVSSGSGIVTLLDRRSFRVIKMFHGFSAPHIPAISPDGRYAYITDDGGGRLTVLGLNDGKLLGRVFVGPGAHHLAFSTHEEQVWVALNESAATIMLLSTVNDSGNVDPGHPHVIGYFHPPFRAHDLLFSPSGKQVWITSAESSYVGVFSSRTRRLLFRVPAGAPPQHLAFAHGTAYITSGYGSSIEQVDLQTGHVMRRSFAPYGSFDLDAAGSYVVTASLLEGTLAIYNQRLRLLRVRWLAPSTEDVALSSP
jgi:DNA-binding beta-propeller fold protein YncE